MNSTSRGWRLISSPVRSPFRSSAGPLVTCSPTPSSAATMYASEVFPSPGGPEKRQWSSASPRARAAAT